MTRLDLIRFRHRMGWKSMARAARELGIHEDTWRRWEMEGTGMPPYLGMCCAAHIYGLKSWPSKKGTEMTNLKENET